MNYVLLAIIIHSSIGAVEVQRAGDGYPTYQACAEDAVGRIESLRALYPDAKIKWDCQKE